jgi:hypothetical protein
MPQSLVLKCRGLYSFPNSLSEIPEGALTETDNVVVDREGVVGPRRGFRLYGDALSGVASTRSKQLLVYKGRVLRHYSTKLEYDSNGSGTFAAFNDDTGSTASITEVSTGVRIKGIEANSNLYFTSSSGIRKISATSAANLSTAQVVAAGGIKALDGRAVLNTGTGFFTQDSVVAYRIIWGYRDANNNLILGSPSERIVIANPLLDLLISDVNGLLTGLDAAAATSGSDALSDTDYSSLTLSQSAAASTVWAALKSLCQKLDADLSVTTYYNSGSAPSIYNDHSTAPNDPATTTELLGLQAFYDDIVNALLIEAEAKIASTAQVAGNFQNSTQSATVDLTFTVPSGVTTNHLYQVYRTALSTSTDATFLSDLDPGDEMGLVYESNPSSGEISAKEITITDITPESFRGANLYTNPNSGEGIAQANEVPPLSLDIGVFKNTVFYANTQTKHRKTINLLSASDLDTTQLVIGVTGGGSLTYTFRDAVKKTTVTCVDSASLVASGTADYFDIYSAGDNKHYRVWFNQGTVVAPSSTGVTLVKVDVSTGDTAAVVASKLSSALDDLDDFSASSSSADVHIINSEEGISSDPSETVANAGFSITVTSTGAGEDATNRYVGVSDAATPAQAVDETARSLVRVINKQSSGAVCAYYISGPDDVPGQILLEARALGTNAFYLNVNSTGAGDKYSPTLPATGQTVASDNEVAPNRIYYSKYQQPEAVPLVNYIDVGAKDRQIQRIVPLRDSLFILKQDGLYRLSGESGNFTVTLFDSSTTIRAADTVSVLNNQIYVMADQGVVTISDTGVQVISRPIENLIVPLMPTVYTRVTTASFGIGYESDRAYLMFTVMNTADTHATRCFRYNTFTSTWTTWDIEKTCGVYNPTADKIYLGSGDTNYIEEERKTFTRLDYADRETALTLPTSGVNGSSLSFGALFGVEVGDVLVQTQYLTVAQFNRLLQKLDNDNGVVDFDYYSTLKAVAGDNLGDKLVALCAKLNADSGVTDTDYTATATTNFVTNQADFNTIVDKLNNDAGVVFTNYRQSSGTVVWEMTVSDLLTSSNEIVLDYALPFIAGPVTAYKHIASKATWAPAHFGDASLTKQVSEATIIFERNNFTKGTASYSTDLSPGFDDVPFVAEGAGTFGGTIFGRTTWGGDGSSKPFRTYVPREKQRCRYIQTRLEHGVAFENYAVFGISYTYAGTSSRGYR